MAVLGSKTGRAARWIVLLTFGLDTKIFDLLVMNTFAHFDIFISLKILSK